MFAVLLTFISTNNAKHIQLLFCLRVVGERHARSSDLFRPVEVLLVKMTQIKKGSSSGRSLPKKNI